MASYIMDVFNQPAKKLGYKIDYQKGILQPDYQAPAPVVQRVLVPSAGGEGAAPASQSEKKRRASSLAMGAGATVLTGSMGVSGAPVITDKKLFGE